MESSENTPLQKIEEEELQSVTGGSNSWGLPTGTAAAGLAVGTAVGIAIGRKTGVRNIIVEAPTAIAAIGRVRSFRPSSPPRPTLAEIQFELR